MRVHALLRRTDGAAQLTAARPAVLALGDVAVDLAERRVRLRGADVHLNRTEFELLGHLAARPRVAVSREALLAPLWGWGDKGASRTVDSHVKALRRKLRPGLIRTVHGAGYALEVPR